MSESLLMGALLFVVTAIVILALGNPLWFAALAGVIVAVMNAIIDHFTSKVTGW